MRTIILVSNKDESVDSRYWLNFVARVREALDRENLEVRIVVAAPAPEVK